jgi:hypothetical protein
MTITPEYQAMEDLREKTNYSWSTLGWGHIWIGIMLRRYHTAHPDGLIRWRTIKSWAKIAEWQMQPGDWKPEDLQRTMRGFLTAGGNRPGSVNRWSITSRSVRPRHYWIPEYSIGRVRSFEEDMDTARVWLERSLEDAEADWLALAKIEAHNARSDEARSHLETNALNNAATSRQALTEVRAKVYRKALVPRGSALHQEDWGPAARPA